MFRFDIKIIAIRRQRVKYTVNGNLIDDYYIGFKEKVRVPLQREKKVYYIVDFSFVGQTYA